VLKKGDAIAALETAKQRGLTRYIGYSGDGAAARYAVESAASTPAGLAERRRPGGARPRAARRAQARAGRHRQATGGERRVAEPLAAARQRLPSDVLGAAAALDYDFLARSLDDAVATALRFTLSVPGVHTAIVGNHQPSVEQNAERLATATLPPRVRAIRALARARQARLDGPDVNVRPLGLRASARSARETRGAPRSPGEALLDLTGLAGSGDRRMDARSVRARGRRERPVGQVTRRRLVDHQLELVPRSP